jgi:hypothetical protein
MGATAWTPTWLSLNKALAADEAFKRDVLLAAKHEADKATAEDADGGDNGDVHVIEDDDSAAGAGGSVDGCGQPAERGRKVRERNSRPAGTE